jgi:hypothetical protein
MDMTETPREAEPQPDKIRNPYARPLLIGLAVQIVIVDAMFLIYAIKGAHWAIPAATMNVWIGAGAIQVVGVVLGITRLGPLRRADKAGKAA